MTVIVELVGKYFYSYLRELPGKNAYMNENNDF